MPRLLLAAVLGLMLAPAAYAQKGSGGNDPYLESFFLAQGAVPNGQLVKVRGEAGGVIGFYFWYDGRIIEVEVKDKVIVKQEDAKDSNKVSKDVLTLLDKKLKSRAKIPDGRLLEIAAEGLKGTPLSDMKYVKNGDNLYAVFGDIMVDVTTGKLVTK